MNEGLEHSLRNGLPKKHLQGFPGTTAQIGKKLPVIKEISAEDLRDAEDEMPVGNLGTPCRKVSPLPNSTTRF